MDKKGNQIIKEAVSGLQKFKLEIPVPVLSLDELKKELSGIINLLITNNFSRLISVLYRLDISEKKLKQLLKSTTNTSAGDIIAEMIIERQLEKIKVRKSFTNNDSNCEEEKW